MHDLIREEFSVSNVSTKDICRHLYMRMLCGKVVIVAEKPNSFLPALRKQWFKLTRRVQRERSSTLNALRTQELSNTIAKMQGLRFTAKWPPHTETADVYITIVDQLLQWAPEYRTLYVTCPIELEHLYMVTAWMPKGGLVLIYKPRKRGVG